MAFELAGSRVMVIGGAGLVGSHLVDQLLETGVTEIKIYDNFVRGSIQNLEHVLHHRFVHVVNGDVLDRRKLAAEMQGTDYVFHLAALWLLECRELPRKGMETNVIGTYNVLEACCACRVKKLIFSSSASVYGNAISVPMTESHPFNNQTFYGATKIAGEQFLAAFREMYGLPCVALRYFNVYGPRQDYRGAYTNVIMRMLDKIDAGERPIIYGDGRQAYDFISVHDVARANRLALESEVTEGVFNIATGVRTSINELAALLLELTGSELEPEYRPAAEIFVTDRVGDTSRARDALGFEARVPLSEGLNELIKWRAARRAREIQLANKTFAEQVA